MFVAASRRASTRVARCSTSGLVSVRVLRPSAQAPPELALDPGAFSVAMVAGARVDYRRGNRGNRVAIAAVAGAACLVALDRACVRRPHVPRPRDDAWRGDPRSRDV